MTVAGMRIVTGNSKMAITGNIEPIVKAKKLETAACQGLTNSSYSIPYFSSTIAFTGDFKKAFLVKSSAEVSHSPFLR